MCRAFVREKVPRKFTFCTTKAKPSGGRFGVRSPSVSVSKRQRSASLAVRRGNSEAPSRHAHLRETAQRLSRPVAHRESGFPVPGLSGLHPRQFAARGRAGQIAPLGPGPQWGPSRTDRAGRRDARFARAHREVSARPRPVLGEKPQLRAEVPPLSIRAHGSSLRSCSSRD